MASVEVSLGVEEVRLEPRHEAADRRAQTDIGDAVDRAAGERVVGAVAGNPHCIDAESRMQIVVKAEIRGRKADRPPASVAGGDPSVDLPEPAEERRGLPRLAGFQQLADLGRGIDGRILAANRLDDGDVEAMLPTGRAQQIRRPTAAVAKGAVPADDDMRGADRSNDDLGDEVVGAFSRKAEIEMLDKQQVDAEAGQFADAARRSGLRLAGPAHARGRALGRSTPRGRDAGRRNCPSQGPARAGDSTEGRDVG